MDKDIEQNIEYKNNPIGVNTFINKKALMFITLFSIFTTSIVSYTVFF